MRNYITENFQDGNTMTQEHINWLDNKLEVIAEEYMKLSDKAFQAETKEKLGTERQKVFGISQTKVEEARHKNIIEEIKALKDAGINSFNRSSYPFFPRHKQPHQPNKWGKAKKQNPATKGEGLKKDVKV